MLFGSVRNRHLSERGRAIWSPDQVCFDPSKLPTCTPEGALVNGCPTNDQDDAVQCIMALPPYLYGVPFAINSGPTKQGTTCCYVVQALEPLCG